MSSENSVFQNHENQTSDTLNSILDLLSHIPNTTHIVNNINHLNEICVPMVGAKSALTGYNTHSNGITGFVPAPLMEEAGKFLRGDGTWQTVVTSVDPLRSAEIQTYISGQDTQAYPYLQSQPDCKNDTVPVLKYNKCLSFGRSNKNISGSGFMQYTSLEMQTDGSDCADVLIAFKTKDTGRSNFLFGNLANVPNGSSVCVKMPTTSGMLLTDNGFTSNGLATFAGGAKVTNGELTIIPKTDSGLSKLNINNWLITSSDSYMNMSHITYSNNNPVTERILQINGTETDKSWHIMAPLHASQFALSRYNNGTLTEDAYTINDTGVWIQHYTTRSNLMFATKSASAYLTGANADFHVNEFNITPEANTSLNSEGGQINLGARVNSGYHTVFIDNYQGKCRIGNIGGNYLTINSINNTIDASKYALSTDSVTSTNSVTSNTVTARGGRINLDINGVTYFENYGLKNTHINVSTAMSSYSESPVGEGNRYYRPVIISKTAPTGNTSSTLYKNGDIWIQYT